MKLILKPISAVLFYLICQTGMSMLAGMLFHPVPPVVFALSMFLTMVLVGLFLFWMHMLQLDTFDPGYIKFNYAHLGVIASLLGIFVASLISGKLKLPDLMDQNLYLMARSKWGVLALAFIGPLTEEMVFREGIIGYLRNHDVGRWTAIISSAIVFAAVHFNPAQIPAALVAGILLGIVYIKSRSVLLTTFVHCINNMVAVMELRRFGALTAGFSFTQILGHQLTNIYLIVCTILCYLFMREFMRKYHRPRHRHSTHHIIHNR